MNKNPKKPKKQDEPPWKILWPADRGTTQGDSNRETLLAAVGFALSTWEQLEEELAQLFTILVGAKWGGPAVRAYGSVNNFYGRADMLEAAAEAFFFEAGPARIKIAGPDRLIAATQPRFKELMRHCRELSARRNDIAHGRYFDGLELGFFLKPAQYNSRKWDFNEDMWGRYSYTSVEINIYAGHFERLMQSSKEVRSAAEIIAKNSSFPEDLA